MNTLPTTDEEVFRILKDMFSSSLVVSNLEGIYRIQKLKGRSVVDSYEYTLLAYLEACKETSK